MKNLVSNFSLTKTFIVFLLSFISVFEAVSQDNRDDSPTRQKLEWEFSDNLEWLISDNIMIVQNESRYRGEFSSYLQGLNKGDEIEISIDAALINNPEDNKIFLSFYDYEDAFILGGALGIDKHTTIEKKELNTYNIWTVVPPEAKKVKLSGYFLRGGVLIANVQTRVVSKRIDRLNDQGQDVLDFYFRSSHDYTEGTSNRSSTSSCNPGPGYDCCLPTASGGSGPYYSAGTCGQSSYRFSATNSQGDHQSDFRIGKSYAWSKETNSYCFVEFNECPELSGYTLTGDISTHKTLCINKTLDNPIMLSSSNYFEYEIADHNDAAISISDLNACRLAYLIENYSGNVTTSLTEAVWFFTRSSPKASSTQGSQNYIVNSAISAVPSVNGNQNKVKFYKIGYSHTQDVIIWDLVDCPELTCQYYTPSTGYVQDDCSVEVCVGDHVVLSTQPDGLASYSWSGPNGYTGTGSSGGDVLISNSVTAAHSGTYVLTATNTAGCSATQSMTINVSQPSISITASNTSVCSGQEVTFTSQISGISSASIQWETSTYGNTWRVISGENNTGLTINSMAASAFFRARLTDSSSGCSAISNVVEINVSRPSILNRISGNTTGCNSQTSNLEINGDGIGTGGLIDYSNWVLNNNGANGFKVNGNSSENIISKVKNPWGENALAWEILPDNNSGNDGGWSTDYVEIDKTKTYRVSVWVNQKERGADGQFYFGVKGEASSLISVATGNSEVNPFFFTSQSPPVEFPKDEWVLFVGHIHSEGYSSQSMHANSGAYLANHGKVTGLNKDYKFNSTTKAISHRVFYNYSTDTKAKQLYAYPRIDLVDGNEPSIQDLLNGFDSNRGLGSSSTWSWHENSCQGSVIATGSTVSLSPTSPTSYYITSPGSCEEICETVTISTGNTPKDSIVNEGPITCNNPSITLTVLDSGNTYEWSNGDSTKVITVSEPGTYTVTITDLISGCSTVGSTVVEKIDAPDVVFDGDTDICIGQIVGVSPKSGGDWVSSNTDVAIISNSGQIVGVAEGSVTFTFTDANSGCSSTTETLNVGSEMDLTIDYIGGVCLTENSQLGVNVAGGIAPYTYSWSGPSSFTGSTSIIDVNVSGNYSVTVTDAYGCEATISGYVYQEYDPYIFSLSTNVCEGSSVSLSVNSSTAVAYQWSNNTGGDTTSTVVVTPDGPSSLYTVTVTNDKGCSSSSDITINVSPKTEVAITGSDNICAGATTTLSPTTGGTWISSNTNVATVSPNGTVTGVSGGVVTFIFNDSENNCDSDPTLPIVISDAPVVSYIGSFTVCKGESTSLSPTTGGTWTSSDESVAIIDNNGVVTTVGAGTTTFTFASDSGCSSSPSQPLTVNELYTTSVTGSDDICVGEKTNLFPTSGGTWTSTNTQVATVTAYGEVTGVGEGQVSFIFVSDANCASEPSPVVTVNEKEAITIDGDLGICKGEQRTLTASMPNGTWSSSNNTIVSISSSGVISGVAAGSAIITYTHNPNDCAIDESVVVTVLPKPEVLITGSTSICVGGKTTVTSTVSSGQWVSNDTSVAIITTNGEVYGKSGGTTSFYYESASGCRSDNSATVTVNPEIFIDLQITGSVCLEANSQITAVASGGTSALSYQWSGPSGFSANTANISVPLSGNYSVVVSDGVGCEKEESIYIYEAYSPEIFAVNTTVCEGENITLSVNNASNSTFQWSGNTNNGTTQSVSVVPTYPSSEYSVTITNNVGCSVIASTEISVDKRPEVTLNGDDPICIGNSVTFTANKSGEWFSNNSSVVSIDNNGVATGISAGTADITFKDEVTGCISIPYTGMEVSPSVPITLTGAQDICVGTNTTFSASVSGGKWTSTNTAVGQIDETTGLFTPLSGGVTIVKYTINGEICYEEGEKSVTVNTQASVMVNGPTSICTGFQTNLLPATGGVWTSDNTSVATVSSNGTVTGVSEGSVSFTFTSTSGCVSPLSQNITIVSSPEIANLGNENLCINETTQLQTNTNGLWLSSNTNVATVNTQGLVTAHSGGVVEISFVEYINGCVSASPIVLTVNSKPGINSLVNNRICQGETTMITPNTGGSWASTDTTIATITNEGIITGVGIGSVQFIYTDLVTGCSSSPSESLVINGRPQTTVNGNTELCIGETSNLLPSSGGTWATSDVLVATISSLGEITAVGEGTATFTFTSTTTGCVSEPSAPFTISNPSAGEITGADSLCVGEMVILSGSHSGLWTSSNNGIASISSSGVITGLAPGNVTIQLNTFAACIDNPTKEITINPLPVVSFTGPTSICNGESTTLSPMTGGVWSSSDPSIATITNQGVVTSINAGDVDFTFTNTVTGCSKTSNKLTIYSSPEIQVIGAQNICIGGSTSLTPSSGGTWTSTNENIASISTTGTVTGIAQGTVSFIFTENSTGCSKTSATIAVLPQPVAYISGDNTICINDQTTLYPTTGGSWMSSDNGVATVTDQGVVTAISQGIARFTFVSDEGCNSNQTTPLIVFGKPAITIEGEPQVCMGSTITLRPTTGGTWSSTNTEIATIDNNGVVTPVTSGEVTFIFTDNNSGCSSNPSEIIKVNNLPNTGVNGESNICIGGTTNMVPSTGGTWASLNPDIATIDNNGQVTGVTAGNAQFVFTHLNSGCVSEPSSAITVNSIVTPSFDGPTLLCLGSTTSVLPNTGGTWESSDPSVATINAAGLIKAVNQGTAKFRYIENGTGCLSSWSTSITVNNTPSVFVVGDAEICTTGNTQLSPSTGGSWVSLNTDIASITSNGLVTGVAQGTAYFAFTDSVTGCTSDSTLSVTILGDISTDIMGEEDLCVGYTIQLTPSTGGTWESSNPSIATISNSGVVTGRSPGNVHFYYTNLVGSCTGTVQSENISVSNCTQHDFNVGVTDLQIGGDVSTNDNMPSGTIYNSVYQATETPPSSSYTLTINSDGTYTFITDKRGNYRFNIPVCGPGQFSGCPSTMLEITIVDDLFSKENPVANMDFAATYANSNPTQPGNMVTISTMSNDQCLHMDGCTLSGGNVSVVDSGNGTVTTMSNGDISYTPAAGFVGYDTIIYQVCTGDMLRCNTTYQVISVLDTSAANSIIASDDFMYTKRSTQVSGNVLANDIDPEQDNILIQAQGSQTNPIVTNEGSYYIDSDGTFQFTPNDNFYGHTEIVYTVCDDNAVEACTDATIHLLVLDDMKLSIKMYLEGSLIKNGNEISSKGEPLMRDNLRNSPYTGLNYIPLNDPYKSPVSIIPNINSKYEALGPHMLPVNQIISDSLAVFSVTGENAIVDWVHIELRSKDNMKTPIASRSALLQRDGDVVDLDGVSPVRFQGVSTDSFYVVAKHRGHLGVMSMKVRHSELIDFTSLDFPVFNFGSTYNSLFDYSGLSTKNNVKPGYRACWAGDLDSNGKIKFTNPFDDQNAIYNDVLLMSPLYLINYDGAIGYTLGDYNMDSKVKYTNPSDDKNLIFSQIILYPLNTLYIANFNFFIEQVPR